MKMHEIKSSNLTHAGFRGTTMYITYKGGVTYRFDPVTKEQFDRFMAADSKGKFLASWGIKGVKE